MRSHWMSLVAATALAAGLAACKGDTGPAGAGGTTGPTGPGGASTGVVSGTLTFLAGATLPATGVLVTPTPAAGGVTATSNATGAYAITLPIGVYSLTFSGTGYTTLTVSNVSVTAGATVILNEVLVHASPLVVTLPALPSPVGFRQTVTLGPPTTTGFCATAGSCTYAWTLQSGPMAGSVSDPAIASPTFTTPTLEAIAAANPATNPASKVEGLRIPHRPGYVGITKEQTLAMTFNWKLLVTDAATGIQGQVVIGVAPAAWTQATTVVPIGVPVYWHDPAPTAAYDFVASTGKPATSTATVQQGATANPYFVPDVAGDYTITNGTTTSITATAAAYVGATRTCGICHGTTANTVLNAHMDAWNNSAHGNFNFRDPTKWLSAGTDPNPLGSNTLFANGVNGVAAGNHYGPSCIECHTVGYGAPGAGGFSDVAASLSWTFPTTYNATTYAGVPAQLQKLAGIQCESCHGPLGQHTANASNPPKAEWGVEVCAKCHDEPPYHDRFSLWSESKHSGNFIEAAAGVYLTDEAIVELRGTTTAHCGRCHAANGFGTYLDQQQAGNPGTIVRPTTLPALTAANLCTPNPALPVDPACPCAQQADVTAAGLPPAPAGQCYGDVPFYTYLSGLGLNRAQVQPQTCQACHDPHTTTLRLQDNTGPLANGWSMSGAGTGAICMVCHNTRNGARGDYVAIPGSGIGGPHAPVQADLYFGQNAYFMGAGGQVSKHAAVQETCVGCHMLLHPTSVSVRNTNHTFTADGTICSACHSSGVGLDALAGQFLVNRGRLETALASAFRAKVGGASPNYYVLVADPGGSGAYANVNLTVAPTNIVPSGRQQNLTMTFATGVSDGWGNTVTTLTVNYRKVSLDGAVDGTGTAYTNPIFSTSGIIAKSNWNYWLVSSVTANPAANVIHNPSFVWDVLANTTSALLAAAAAGGAGL